MHPASREKMLNLGTQKRKANKIFHFVVTLHPTPNYARKPDEQVEHLSKLMLVWWW